MSHVLVISDAKGNVLAKVPVEPGYRIREVHEPKPEKPKAPTDDKVAGDSGSGIEKVG